MRARNIKPAFFKDVELSECSFEARLLFQGYWCLADRAGLLIFSPKLIKAEVFPYDDVDVISATNELIDVGMIVAYIHDVTTIISIPNFAKHQRPHPNEEASKLPQPDENTTLLTKVESTSYQGVKRFALNPDTLMRNDDTPLLESGVTKKDKNKNHEGFDEFWMAYPNKIAKQSALKAWNSKKPILAEVLAGLEAFKKSKQWTKNNGEYIPHGSTFLNQERWKDSPTIDAPKAAFDPWAPNYLA